MKKIKAIKIFIFVPLTVLLFVKCNIRFQRAAIVGTYEREHYGERLIFTDSSFVYFRDRPLHNLPLSVSYDTVQFGKWNVSSNVKCLLLTSPENYLKSKVSLNVQEQRIPNDTIRLVIHSPAEIAYYDDNSAVSGVVYHATIYSQNYEQSEEVKSKTDSVIDFINSGKKLIDSFKLRAYVSTKFPITPVGTNEVQGFHNVVMKGSNKFVVNIPELTINFLAAKRLNNDSVKIISKRKLLWHGIIYKKSKGL